MKTFNIDEEELIKITAIGENLFRTSIARAIVKPYEERYGELRGVSGEGGDNYRSGD